MTDEPNAATKRGRVFEVFLAFLKMGVTCFGGPIAHLGYYHEEFVVKRRWLDEAAFTDLVALCSFLPGATSTQVVFGLGMRRAGIFGALVAVTCFILPSAILLVAFGYLAETVGGVEKAGWLHGLKLAAVAVVAQAVWTMGRNLCTDRARLSMCLAAGALLLAFPGALCQIGVILVGGVLGWAIYRKTTPAAASAPEHVRTKRHVFAAGVIVLFFVLLATTPVLARWSGEKLVAQFDSFYRSGSLVFGGGHVVLPLLRAEVVLPGWVTDSQFLAGYGAAQAIPGPLFTFSGYLGVMMNPGSYAWLGALVCLVAMFLPGLMLVGGTLPFWEWLRAKTWVRAALCGTNAAVVGILLAALYNPVFKTSVGGVPDFAVTLIAFGLLVAWKVPQWVIVLFMAAAGQWIVG